MMLLLAILALTLANINAQNRVIEITTSNVQLVLKTVDKLHLLLHDPNCQHSRDYAQKFLQVKTPLQLGIADCQRQKQLCKHLNATHFPSLAQLTSTTISFIDEQSFLVDEGLVEENDPKLMLNSIVRRLKGDQGWAAVVLEEEGLPVLQRVENQKSGVFYVAPPSRLYSHISAMVGRKLGCWILANKEKHLEKYYCGNGYKSEELLKYIQNYQKDKLVRHIFTREANSTHMGQAELSQIVKENYAAKRCKLVYFHSKQCEHCSSDDIKRIESVTASLKLKDRHQVQVYDLDHEELPPNFKLKRIPELVQFCNFQMTEFGDIFTIEKITNFLSRTRNSPKAEPTKPTVIQQPSVVQPTQPAADQRVEL